jgi:hypothetical protein
MPIRSPIPPIPHVRVNARLKYTRTDEAISRENQYADVMCRAASLCRITLDCEVWLYQPVRDLRPPSPSGCINDPQIPRTRLSLLLVAGYYRVSAITSVLTKL